jgi:hypothetical protein
MSGKLKLEMLLSRICNSTQSERVRLKNFVCVCVCVCELGMPIIFVFYMMMEAEPTYEMCFNF